jgi:hypothetical protein
VSAREDEIRRVVAELDVQVAEVEASLAVLKALWTRTKSRARKTELTLSSGRSYATTLAQRPAGVTRATKRVTPTYRRLTQAARSS